MWDPDQYLVHADHRRRPVLDLLARVPVADVGHIVDLGCGAGQLSALLRARWPDATITAIDADEAMLTRARAEHTMPDLHYVHADISSWEPSDAVDLVFSNAALHWLPDHLDLMARYTEWLTPQGCLAVQVPGNTAAPSHQAVVDQRRSARWCDAVGSGAEDHVAVARPATYAAHLAAQGLAVDVWETTYIHILDGDDPVVGWLAGSTLRPVLSALDEGDAPRFLAELADRLRPHYPPDAAGRTYLPFRRIFVVASENPAGAQVRP